MVSTGGQQFTAAQAGDVLTFLRAAAPQRHAALTAWLQDLLDAEWFDDEPGTATVAEHFGVAGRPPLETLGALHRAYADAVRSADMFLAWEDVEDALTDAMADVTNCMDSR